MTPPALIVITDTTVAPAAVVVRRIDALLSVAPPGSVVVQLRDVHLGVRERLALGGELLASCRRRQQRLVVNDRLDLAVVLGADGVHLGERSVAANDARAVLGERAWISCAWHDARCSPPPSADAVLLSPVCADRKGRTALGLRALGEFRSRLDSLPERPALYALGGVDAGRVADLVRAGADGVAAIGAAIGTDDPKPLLDALSAAGLFGTGS